MRDFKRTGLNLGAVLAATAMVVTLSACGGGADSAGDQAGGSSSADQPNTVESPSADAPDSDSEKSILDGLNSDEALAIGLDGGAAITCGYTFDDGEISEMKMIANGWVTPEATIHLQGASVFWEVPQEDGRMSHILYNDHNTYTWKSPGDSQGIMGAGESDDLPKLAVKLQKNAHDCTAFSGSMSVFDVPAGMTFVEF